MQSVFPSDIIACKAISKAFLTILEYCKESKSEGLRARLCILFGSSVYPACCQDYAICHFLRLLQSFHFLVTSSCSWSIWTLYRLRQPTRSRLGPTKTQCWLKCKDLCPMVGFLKSQREECSKIVPGGGTITLAPQSTQPSSTLNSCKRLSNRRPGAEVRTYTKC